jgi:hypothetical protein
MLNHIREWENIPGNTIHNIKQGKRGLVLEFEKAFVELAVNAYGLCPYFFPVDYVPGRDRYIPAENFVGKTILSITVPFVAPGHRDDFSIGFFFDDGTQVLLKSEDACSPIVTV